MKGGKSGPSKDLLIDKIVTGQMPPDVTGKQQYWIGNWPGEFGGPCGVRPDAPTTAQGGPSTIAGLAPEEGAAGR